MAKFFKSSMKNQNGFTLVELLIALGLTSIAVLGLVTLVGNSQKSANSVFDKLDVESLRNTIRLQMSCEKTIDNMSGPGSILINKRDEDLFPRKSKEGKMVMDTGKNYLWVESYDDSTGELSLLVINKSTKKESPLFKTVPFFCEPKVP